MIKLLIKVTAITMGVLIARAIIKSKKWITIELKEN